MAYTNVSKREGVRNLPTPVRVHRSVVWGLRSNGQRR